MDSPPHDKAETPCQLKLNYQTPQQSTKETSWDNGEIFITMMQDKTKLCNKKLKNRKNRDGWTWTQHLGLARDLMQDKPELYNKKYM